MKKQNIFMCLIFVITLVFTSNIVVNAETLPSLSDMVNNIEPYNFDGNDYPNIRGKDVNLTVYAYLNPKYGHGSADNPSLPAPFNKHYTYSSTGTKTFYVGAVSSPAGGYDAYLFYCVGYGMPVDTGETLVSSNNVYGWNESVIDEHSKNLISLALIYGFDSDSSHGSSVSSSCLAVRNTPDGRHVYANAPKVFATQVACWVASTNLINSQYEDLIARYLIEIDGQLEEETYYIYSDIIGKVKKAMKMPTYASTDPNNTPVYELQYNSEKKRFEYTMTDDNELGLNGDKITITQKLEGTGLNCEVDGNRVTIYTNTVVGTKNNPVKVSIQKDINNGRGVAGFWQKQGLSSGKIGQPLTRLVDDSRTPEFGYYSVYTPGYKIRIHKTLQSTSGNKGNASPRGAVYGIYKDERCSEEVARLTIDENGYSNKTDYLEYRTYYVREIYNTSSTRIDETVYTINPQDSATDSDGDYGLTLEVSDWINESTIKIHKKLGATDYDKEIDLSNCKFKITLNEDNNQVYYTNVSGADGICEAKNVPFGVYTVSEIEWPDEAYKVEDFTINVQEHGKTYESTKVDESKKMRIEVEKVLLDEVVGKTDAKVSGAYFTVYKDANATIPYLDKNGNTVIIGPTDSVGHAISGTMRTGTYYLKETTFPEGINPDAVVPGESVTFREKIYTASYDNRNQGTDTVTVSIKRIINIPNLGRIHVIKYNNNFNSTDEVPAAGAILALTLKSNKDCVYYATINEKGYAQFINKDLENLGYEYTIPYGIYEISEIQESNPKEHTHFYLQPETVEIKRDTQVEYRIHSDEPVPAWLKIVKEDKDSKQVVKLEGAKYKIWDVNNNDWVSMMLYPSGEYINEFETNDEGYLYTPQAVQPGTYVIYETQAPEGYYLDDEWRLPEKEEDLGNDKVSGKKVVINKLTTGILDDTSYPEGGIVTGSLVVNTDIKNTPLKVDLELYKKAEKITGVTTSEVNYEIDNEVVISEEKYRPTYSLVGLEGVGYRIYAVEDTYTPDGILRYTKGQMIADITTNEEGYAVARDIYPGEYSIIEYKTPIGYIKDENIPNVILENKNQYVKNATVKKELTDIRQKLGLKFKKNFEEVKYTIGEKVEQKAVFGIYTSEPILNYKGNAVIPKNALVDLVEINGSTDVISNRDLPKGKYYVIELYTSAPYTINSKKTEFELEYNDDSEQEYVVVEGEEYNNKPTDGNFVIVKLSSDIHSEGFIVMNGTEIINDELDKIQKKVIEDIGKLNNDDEIMNYLNENKMHFLPGAKFRIYADKECSEGKEVRVRDEVTGEFKILEIVTNKVGLIRVNNIPIGEYYIKEIEAPDGCQLPEEEEKRITKIVVENNLTNENKVYQTIVNDSIVGGMIYKEDIFTSEAIPDCIYEIRDENGNVLLHSKTTLDGDGNAVAYIPLSMFENNKKYTFVEIKAPDIYEIDTTPHEFEAKFDENGKWITEPIKVTNKRKTRQVIVRKLDAETSEPLQGCVFTIALIDPKTGEQKVDAKTGEPIYLVENAITNENGEYVIDKAPMGTYKFIEIKAPEGYELDEDLTGYEFTIDNNSPETIIFEVTNTGDIQVIVLSIVSIISLIGIAIIMKNKIICKN